MDPKLQRRHERFDVQLEAQFGVLVPEATFQPMNYIATVLDLSERGAMIGVQLEHTTYVSLLQKTRYCRLAFAAGSGLPDRVIGKAVWIQPVGKGEDTSHKIGLFFEDIDPDAAAQIKEFLAQTRAAQENGQPT